MPFLFKNLTILLHNLCLRVCIDIFKSLLVLTILYSVRLIQASTRVLSNHLENNIKVLSPINLSNKADVNRGKFFVSSTLARNSFFRCLH